jgi:4-amino-4-deoxy-L-arabinose transferase-like glycosyltransferase
MNRLALRLHAHRSLLLILLVYLALGGLYNVSLPLFEAPDEAAHFRYIHWLAEERRLPDMVADYPAIGHEIWQPPLYYALMAPLAAAVDRADLEHVAPPNPHWRTGGGRHVHYHTAAEAFPYRQTTLAVRLVRLASTLLASLVIISAYALGRLLAPRQAVIAAALVAFNPQFVAIGAAVNNDSGIAAFSSLALVVLILIGQRAGNWRAATSWTAYGWLGLFWGLAMLTKVSGLALGGVILPGLILAALRQRSWQPLSRGLPLTGLTAALVAGWYYLRSWRLYGDPLAWEIMERVTAGLLRPAPLSWPETWQYAAFLRRSYWAAFGHGIFAPELFYLLVNGVMVAAALGLAFWLWPTARAHRRSGGRWPGWQQPIWRLLLLSGWSLIVFLSLMRWMRLVSDTNQGRLLFPAAAALALLLALGLAGLSQVIASAIISLRARVGTAIVSLPATVTRSGGAFADRTFAGWAAVLLLAIWAAALPLVTIQPAFARPPLLDPAAAIDNPLAIRLGPSIALKGYVLSADRALPGESLVVDLIWQATAVLSESYAVALHVTDADGAVVSRLDTVPYDGRFPTPTWPVGQPFQDRAYLAPIGDEAAPGLATIWLSLYPWGQPDQPLPIYGPDSQQLDGLALAQFKIRPAQPRPYTPSQPAAARFGQLADLLGYDVPPQVAPGGVVPLTLYWQALAAPAESYTVFVHLVNAGGQLLTQADGPPQDGRYPTTIWDAGEQIRDERRLIIPADAPAGVYRLLVGFYHSTTGERLPVSLPDGQELVDGVYLLHELSIRP